MVADLRKSHAPASVHKPLGVVPQVLAMAVRENRLAINPVDGELPSVQLVEQRFLTLDQLHALAAAAGAHIKSLQNMLGHESAALTLDRYSHLYGSDVEAPGVATNALLIRKCGQNKSQAPPDSKQVRPHMV